MGSNPGPPIYWMTVGSAFLRGTEPTGDWIEREEGMGGEGERGGGVTDLLRDCLTVSDDYDCRG